MSAGPKARWGTRWTLVGLLAVFVVPWIGAFLWEPTGYVNHGELVVPARPLEPVRLRTADDTAYGREALRRTWTMIFFLPARCGEGCERSLYNMRQVRLAQGRRSSRVRLVAVARPESAEFGARLVERYPAFTVVTGEPVALDEFSRQFVLKGAPAPMEAGRIYLVDPIGNLMMSFAPGSDPSGIRKDLVRLLKVSQVG